MQLKVLSVLACAALPLIATGSAKAGFLGLKTVVKEAGLIDHDNNPGTAPVAAIVVNLFATFDRPGTDRFLSAAGTPGGPLDIHVVGGEFYQNSFGDAAGRAPSAALVAAFPALAFDSFVTIGVKKSGQPGGQPVDSLVLTPGWPGFGTGPLTGTNLGWAVTPVDQQGDPFNPAFVNGNGQILIGQFTTTNGSAISGMLHLLVTSNDAPLQLNTSFFAVPSPGALALMGVAGMVGARRRRRA